MNGADPLARLADVDPQSLQAPAPFDLAELQVLREFYKRWEALHAIPRDKMHRKKSEEAAAALVSQAHILRRMNG